MVFSEGEAFLRHKAIGQAKNIRLCVKNLYKLDVDGYAALIGKEYKGYDIVFNEGKAFLRHKKMAQTKRIWI